MLFIDIATMIAADTKYLYDCELKEDTDIVVLTIHNEVDN
jgi:hypothetical protein